MPTDSNVTDVQVTLRVLNSSGASAFSVYLIDPSKSVNANQVTYSRFRGSTVNPSLWELPGANGPTDRGAKVATVIPGAVVGGYINFSIPEATVSDWASSANSNRGILIQNESATPGDFIEFGGQSNGTVADRPSITITWTSNSYFWWPVSGDNFNEADNWSELDGFRINKGTFPDDIALHRAIFSNTRNPDTNGNVNLQTGGAKNIRFFQTKSNFSGSISNSTAAINVGDQGFFLQSATVFNANQGVISVAGDATMANGSQLSMNDFSFVVGGDIRVQSNGTSVVLTGGGNFEAGGAIDFRNDSSIQVGSGNLIAGGNMIMRNGSVFNMTTGNVDVRQLTLSNTSMFNMGNGTINAPLGNGLNVANDSTLNKGDGTITARRFLISSSVPVTLTGETVDVTRDVDINNGTLNMGAGTLTAGTTMLVRGSGELNASPATITLGTHLDVRNTAVVNLSSGDLIVNVDVLLQGGELNMSTGTLFVGNRFRQTGGVFNMTDASFTIIGNLELVDGTFNSHPGVDLVVGASYSQTGGTMIAPPAGRVMHVGLSFQQSGGTFQHNNGLVVMEGLGAPYNTANSNASVRAENTLWDLRINRTQSNNRASLSGNLVVENDITMQAGELRLGSNTLFLGRDWIRAGEAGFLSQTGTVVLDRANTVSLSEPLPFYNVTVAKTGGARVDLGLDLDVDGALRLESGELDQTLSNRRINVAGDLIRTSGSLNPRQGWIILDGGDQAPALADLALANLSCTGSGTKSFTGGFTHSGSLTVSTGVVMQMSTGTFVFSNGAALANQSVNATFQQGVGGYSGATDTEIDASAPTTNKGANDEITIDGVTDRGALLSWDLSDVPPGAVVSSAAMRLNITAASTQTYQLYQMRRGWTEGGATWQTADGAQDWGTVGANNTSQDRFNTTLVSTPTNVTGDQDLDLSGNGVAVVQGWVNSRGGNHGFLLANYSRTSPLSFRSAEFATAASRPRLAISYETLRGTMRIGAGGIVQVPDGTAIVQGTSATWEFRGTSSSSIATAATLTVPTVGTQAFTMHIPAGGTLTAYGARIVSGTITMDAAPGAVDIADASFETLPSGATCFIDLSGVSGGSINLRRLNFTRGSFVGATIARNIRSDASTQRVMVGGFSGNLGGEPFDEDPLNLIRWSGNAAGFEIVHSTLGTSQALTLRQALSNLPAGGQTLTVRGHYANGGAVVTAFARHSGLLTLGNFGGTLNIDGVVFINRVAASGVVLNLSAKNAGVVNLYNSSFADFANGGVARAVVVPPTAPGSITCRFSTLNTTQAAAGFNGTVANCIFTMSLTAGQRSTWFSDHSSGDYHLTATGISSGGFAATRDATYTRDLDGKTRPSGANATFRGCFHARSNAVSVLVSRDLSTGTILSTDERMIFSAPPANNTAGNAVYLAGSADGLVRVSAMNRTTLAVPGSATLTFAGYAAGFVTHVQATDDAAKWWLYLPYDSTGNGSFDSIRRVLHDSGTSSLTDQGTLTALNRSGGAIDFASNGGWSGLLNVQNEFAGVASGELQLALTTPTAGGQIHVWYVNPISTDGGLYRTAAFDDPGVAAEGYIGGTGFSLSPNPIAQVLVAGTPSSGNIYLTRIADANSSVLVRFSRQNAGAEVTNVVVDNAVSGVSGASYAARPFIIFKGGGRLAMVRSDLAQYDSLSHNTWTVVSRTVPSMAGFCGAPGLTPSGFFTTQQLFFGLHNSSTGEGAVVAAEYWHDQDGNAALNLLDSAYSALGNTLRYHDDTGTNGSFSNGVARVVGMPVRVLHAPYPASNAVVFCATDAGLVYCWEGASQPNLSSTANKGQLLPGFPVRVEGGRITGGAFLTVSEPTLQSALNLSANANALAITTDSGQTMLFRIPENP